jgi:hypothetical protein
MYTSRDVYRLLVHEGRLDAEPVSEMAVDHLSERACQTFIAYYGITILDTIPRTSYPYVPGLARARSMK